MFGLHRICHCVQMPSSLAYLCSSPLPPLHGQLLSNHEVLLSPVLSMRAATLQRPISFLAGQVLGLHSMRSLIET